MRKFDYSFLNNGLLPANLVNLTSNIAALKTMAGVRKDEYTQIFTELEAVAKVQSIKRRRLPDTVTLLIQSTWIMSTLISGRAIFCGCTK